jgi:hypothetical protein
MLGGRAYVYARRHTLSTLNFGECASALVGNVAFKCLCEVRGAGGLLAVSLSSRAAGSRAGNRVVGHLRSASQVGGRVIHGVQN